MTKEASGSLPGVRAPSVRRPDALASSTERVSLGVIDTSRRDLIIARLRDAKGSGQREKTTLAHRTLKARTQTHKSSVGSSVKLWDFVGVEGVADPLVSRRLVVDCEVVKEAIRVI